MSGYKYRGTEKAPTPKKTVSIPPEVKALLDQAKKAIADLKASNAAVQKEKEDLQKRVKTAEEELNKKTRLLSNANAHLAEKNATLTHEIAHTTTAREEAEKALAEELDKNLLSRLQEAYAKNDKLIADLVTMENTVKPNDLLEEENASLKQQNQSLETRVVELESLQQSLMEAASEPVEEVVIFTGELQEVTVKGAPIPVSKSTLGSLAGAKLQFTVVAP